jgi:hypothetical protein
VSGFGAFAVGDIASPLPMELHTFTGKRAGASVELRWTTLSEINSLRYAVERRTPEDADWREIGAVPASGGSDVGIEYMFTDNAPPAGKRALYRLKMVDRDGSFAYSSILDIGSEIPTEIALDAVHPNPFTDATAVSFTLPSEEYVNLAVYDATGRRVRTLTAGMLPAGSHTRNFSAEDLPGGVYHIILSAGDAWRARSVVLAR